LTFFVMEVGEILVVILLVERVADQLVGVISR
jgi:hypothetical protein